MDNTEESRSQRWVRQALDVLGIDRLALIVFDAMLPRAAAYDLGTGSPYSDSARQFFDFVAGLGFNGLQFGPQGAVSRDFPSPYDSTALSRNPLAIALERLPLMELFDAAHAALPGGLVPMAALESAILQRPASSEFRVAHRHAFDHQHRILTDIADRLMFAGYSRAATPLKQRFDSFCAEHDHWLLADGLYDRLCRAHRATDFSHFDEHLDAHLWQTDLSTTASGEPSLLGYRLRASSERRLRELSEHHAEALERYRWVQFIIHAQHEELHAWATRRGLELYGDLHVGYARRDLWHYRSVFLADYCLGAPPSRTNPEGQAWGCPVLDPELYFEPTGGPGPALRLLALRAKKLFAEYDRMRIDHPHGLICPWVYHRNTGDDVRAVQAGARLFSSPDLADHPSLAKYALISPEQIDRHQSRHADGWLAYVTPRQTRDFARAFDVLARQAQALGSADRLLCEVLSTQPTELRAVLRSYGLGRFRVTQKANVDDENDVYLSNNAAPEDWMLLGNHDTPPIWHVVERWQKEEHIPRQASYLAARLSNDETARRELHRELLADPSALVHAKLADLFVSDARNVLISFSDLFGFREPYNVPGTVSESNWSQRLPPAFEAAYEQKRARGAALDLRRAMRLALGRIAPNSPLLDRQT